MKVLLTGASGFVGARVLPSLLRAGHEVCAVSRQPLPQQGGLTIVSADLLAPGAAERLVDSVRPDLIVHLAWFVDHGKFWTDPVNSDWVEASIALFRAGAACGVRRFVGIGTCFEYAWPDDANCDEAKTPLAGHTLYDMCKSSLRAKLDALSAQTDVSFAWARLFHLYGPGENVARLVPDVARKVLAGQAANCSSGKMLTDQMHIDDAGAAIAAIALSDVVGSVNVGTGIATEVADVARCIGEIAGRPDLVRIGALADRAGEPRRIVADVGKLRDEVGFTPRFALRDGLADAINALKHAV